MACWRMKMSIETQVSPVNIETDEGTEASNQPHHWKRDLALKSLLLLLVFAVGIGSGYLMGRRSMLQTSTTDTPSNQDQSMALMHQVNPPEGYKIPAVFGDIGPQMVAEGSINMPMFISIYEQQNKPLTDEQMKILIDGSNTDIEINPENAYFLLNFLWAFGLTNQNPILTEGPMMSGGMDKVGGFASTGGWTLGST